MYLYFIDTPRRLIINIVYYFITLFATYTAIVYV